MEMLKQKLTSRKFWVAFSTIVSGVLMLFNYAETDIETVTGAILVIGGAVSYCVAEGIVDAARIKSAVGAVIDATEVIVGEGNDD